MARAGKVSDVTATAWLDWLRANGTHVGLSTQDPYAVADPLTVEPTATGYARAAVTWNVVGRVLRNAIAVSWTGLPAGTRVVAITIWDAAVNGRLLAAIYIDPPNLTAGGGFPVAAGDLFVGLDV